MKGSVIRKKYVSLNQDQKRIEKQVSKKATRAVSQQTLLCDGNFGGCGVPLVHLGWGGQGGGGISRSGGMSLK